jgi:Bacterial PH domain
LHRPPYNRIVAFTVPADPSGSFSASYDAATKWISASIIVVFLAIVAATHAAIVGFLTALVLVGAYAWSPRAYSISDRSILVKRLSGSLRLPLDDVLEASIATADDLRGCIRMFGNGGLFGYYGLFRTSRLGNCSWYVTNRTNMIVVVTSAKTAILSPDDVDGFLAAVRAAVPVPSTPPVAPLFETGGGTGILVGVAIAAAVIGLVTLALTYSPGPP